MAFAARGTAASQWWRHGHSHLDESEIWLWNDGKYTRLVEMGAKNLWPMWMPDGKSLYFVSDRGGAENIWLNSGGQSRQVTKFKDGRVLWPSISYDGKTIVFERNFGIWKLDVASGKTAPIEITRRGALGAPGVNHLREKGHRCEYRGPESDELGVSGKKRRHVHSV